MANIITDRDVTEEVLNALGTDASAYDVPAIVDALREQFGPFGATDTLDVEHDDFWKLVWSYPIEDGDDECEGHESLSGPAGVSVYCDGTCIR